jgi:NAD(P)-dependent dehydrogenase (short-subunit alcohol dehydrogenase family)
MTDHGALPDFSVAGLHVLITGGTGGIGGAFARAFVAKGATATVTDVAPPAARCA